MKPEPPSDVAVRQEEGREKWMTATWGLPNSWKSQDRYYELIYEIKYRPLKSTLSHGQVGAAGQTRSAFYSCLRGFSGLNLFVSHVEAHDEAALVHYR